MRGFGKGLSLAFFFFFPPFFCSAQEAGVPSRALPQISRLDRQDYAFRQFISDVETNRRRLFLRERNREDVRAIADSLIVFQYSPRENEDIFHLAARSNIPYSTLASLNRLSHPSSLETGRPILLPTIPGIFVPDEPVSDLEHLLASTRESFIGSRSVPVIINTSPGGQRVVYHFIPGEDFTATERAFFLQSGFRFPLRYFRRTSGFGMRRNPVTGNWRMHEGLDLAAPAGTEVLAAAAGTVTEVGYDPIFGNFIIISHANNWASLYGHLQRAGVTLHSRVNSGSVIGWVGSTGQSTGPHLHFELRHHGRAQDPDKFLFQPGRRR